MKRYMLQCFCNQTEFFDQGLGRPTGVVRPFTGVHTAISVPYSVGVSISISLVISLVIFLRVFLYYGRYEPV